MARCGCAVKCNCVFEEGGCIELEITATPGADCASPTLTYAISVNTDDETVFCGAGGLNAVLNHQDTNTIDLEGTGSAGSPLEAHVIRTADGSVPDTSGSGLGNLVKEIAGPGGGIYVSCEDVQDCVGAAIDAVTTDCLEYDDATNTISILICGEPNGIECVAAGDPDCPTGGLAVIPSSDADNSLGFGTDDRLFAAAAAIIPGECMTFTGTGTQADPFVITPTIAPEPNGVECVPGQGLAVIPSADANNGLTFGGDQRLFINRCPFVNGGSQVLTGNAGPCFEFVGGTDCVTPMVATLRLSDDLCQGLECRADGLFVLVDNTDLPAPVELISNIGPLGPFNGNIVGPEGAFVTVEGPTCIQISNPSPCRNMVTLGTLGGFIDGGRTSGAFRIAIDADFTGGPGPFFSVSQWGAHNPNPANRFTTNIVWSGNEITVAPGGTRSICSRVNISNAGDVGQPINNGRIFNLQRIFRLIAAWQT